MNIEDFGNTFSLNIEKNFSLDYKGVAFRVTELYSKYYELISDTVHILKNYKLGYSSPEDYISSIEDNQQLKNLGKRKVLNHLFKYT